MRRFILGLFFVLGIAGCSSAMLNTKDVHWAKGQIAGPSLFASPSDHAGERTILGGVILRVRSRSDMSTIRLLAYPLDRSYYPETEKKTLGPATIVWTGPPLSTLFVRGNRISVAGRVLSSGDSRHLRIMAKVLSPDTCLSAGGFVCHRSLFGCSCHNE